MKQITKLLLIACTCSIVPSLVHCTEQKSQRFSSLFRKPKHEEIMTKEYRFERPHAITITNSYGSITIKAGWEQKKIALSAHKSSSSVDELSTVRIVEKRSAQGDIALTVAYDGQEKKIGVHLVLVVPPNKELTLVTTKGSIITEKITGALCATTSTGSITIKQASGALRATSTQGSIHLYDTTDSVLARTEKGSIHLTCKKLPTTAKLNVHTTCGDLYVTLPDEINADLKAKTERGTLICEHFVTIKPFTTQWNKKAWNQLKHEICGTLGTGEASIMLHSRGTIKINKYV